MEKKITTVLFDLDGTLLPLDQDHFMKLYFRELSARCAPLGYEPEALVKAVWEGTAAMVQNDGSMWNKDRFWSVFASRMGEQAYEQIPVFDDFYTREFHRAKASAAPDPAADACVKTLKSKGYTLVLATNPLFPRQGTLARMQWAGLDPEDFALITTYEICRWCKPSPEYFSQILKEIHKTPEECLMVGNDAAEDMVAMDLGMDFFLADTCLLHEESRDLQGISRGSLKDLLALLETWPKL